MGNICFLSPLVLSKWEDLAFSVCMLFEESVFIFQFLNNKIYNNVLFDNLLSDLFFSPNWNLWFYHTNNRHWTWFFVLFSVKWFVFLWKMMYIVLATKGKRSGSISEIPRSFNLNPLFFSALINLAILEPRPKVLISSNFIFQRNWLMA